MTFLVVIGPPFPGPSPGWHGVFSLGNVFRTEKHLLRYCAWCGRFQGAKAGNGYQVRENRSEIDTATICSSCFARMAAEGCAESEFGRGSRS